MSWEDYQSQAETVGCPRKMSLRPRTQDVQILPCLNLPTPCEAPEEAILKKQQQQIVNTVSSLIISYY